ncbi:hypothetical protein M441DRAFT_22045 [Trichoderma asperellum CBS 433.97]|uniref:Uncharacterized protein n=2 Tax=Trichoderma asperellum TaxID=101201 RepID=A0A2T3ZM99_TRIA4|nr:hypothetical protein M441DRAFT_22045 [Trichoderma asperellum CBS 433.97]PTB45928.1 hypothetical protein M441DRAFT_22045 [Trichoderma asperellum CBS 433.97]
MVFSEMRQNGQLPAPENKFAHWIPGQKVYVQRSFILDSGVEMHNVPVAYMTWDKERWPVHLRRSGGAGPVDTLRHAAGDHE